MAQTLVTMSTPSDGIATYQRSLLERAPNNNGIPGAFTQIANVAVDASNEFITYTDTGGTTTDWYRYRYANTALTSFSAYSANSLQAGDYLVRQWIKADVTDADLVNADWDRWRDEVLVDISQEIGREVYPPQVITPTANTTEFYPLDAGIRKVLRVEIYNAAGWFIASTVQWWQFGRQLRLLRPDTTRQYKVYGLGLVRNLGDLDQEAFMVLYWGMRLKYIDKRLAERANTRFYLTSDKNSDVTLPQLQSFRDKAEKEFDERLAQVRPQYSFAAYSR